MAKIKLMLIASGGGTDADSIMKAWEKGCIPDVEEIILVSTKEGAGCLEKAKKLGIKSEVIDRKECESDEKFNLRLGAMAVKYDISCMFLVGCIVRIYADDFDIPIYNIHPACTEKYGGNGMYGLEVHNRVMHDAIDAIDRGKKNLEKDRFFTHPTVHEVVIQYDSGAPLLTQAVEVPQWLLQKVIDGRLEVEEAAEELQQIVLPYEWLMLPTAVNIAARKILNDMQMGE